MFLIFSDLSSHSSYIIANPSESLINCSFTPTKQTLHKGTSKNTRDKDSPALQFQMRNKDDVLSLSNSTFGDYIGPIYSIELDIKDAT
jgi:hypothetical protein